MNKLFQTILFTLTLIIVSSCVATVKLKNSWKADNFEVIKSEKILVINKSEREGVRQRGEREIANKLREKGIDAVEAFVAFPNFRNRNDRTPEEVASIVKTITEAGYNGIVITKLKNPENEKTTTTRLTDQDKSDETAKYYDTSDYGKYPVSFGVYYNNPAGVAAPPNRTPGPSGLEETTDNYTEVYELETLSYNMTSGQEQLLGSFSIEITDPENIMDVITKYATLVAKQF